MKIQAAGTVVPLASEVEEQPPAGPPYDPSHEFGLPSREDIEKGLRAQRDREVGSAKHESAVGTMSEGSDGVATPFAHLDATPLARTLTSAPEDAGIIVIGGFDAGRRISSLLDAVALNPQPLPPGDPETTAR